jgi:hypothetical protein
MEAIKAKLLELTKRTKQIDLYQKFDVETTLARASKMPGEFDAQLLSLLKFSNGLGIFDYCFMGFKNPKLGQDIDSDIEALEYPDLFPNECVAFMSSSSSEDFGYLVNLGDAQGNHPIAYNDPHNPYKIFVIASSFEKFMHTFLSDVEDTLDLNPNDEWLAIEKDGWPCDMKHWLKGDVRLQEMYSNGVLDSFFETRGWRFDGQAFVKNEQLERKTTSKTGKRNHFSEMESMAVVRDKLVGLRDKSKLITLYQDFDVADTLEGISRVPGEFDVQLLDFLKFTNGCTILGYGFLGFGHPKYGLDIDEHIEEMRLAKASVSGEVITFMVTSAHEIFGYLRDLVDAQGNHAIAYNSRHAPEKIFVVASSFENFMKTFLNDVDDTISAYPGKFLMDIKKKKNWPVDLEHWRQHDPQLGQMYDSGRVKEYFEKRGWILPSGRDFIRVV